MRGSLEDSLKHAEVEMDKLKELLHSEQQALQAVMLEKKEQMKHSRRVMADVKRCAALRHVTPWHRDISLLYFFF
jgi:hypothetical protein